MKPLFSIALAALLGGSAWARLLIQTFHQRGHQRCPSRTSPVTLTWCAPSAVRHTAQLYSDLAQEHLLKAEDARSQTKSELESWERTLRAN
jgi:hypothetical protein